MFYPREPLGWTYNEPVPGTTATLLVTCPERRGLVAELAGFVARHNGNIIQADHHSDFNAGLFLSRLEWEVEGFDLDADAAREAFTPIAQSIDATWQLRYSDSRTKTAVFVSKQDHCLLDLVWRAEAGELNADIVFVLSNHPDLAPVAERHGLPFFHVPVSSATKPEAEAEQLRLIRDHGVSLVVMAKYMQILSSDFVRSAPPVINIHHSFLPAFIGDRPYHKAHARGVKLIGATAHYATSDLDEGPIIEQEVTRVSHRDNIPDLVRRGRDLERLVLARAVRLHLENRVLVYGNRTVVFA